jgi:Zn ribbon nucleic-acid-binding protein
MIQAVAQQMQQQQVQAARFGAKLNYIRNLKGLCPEGQEPKYFKVGGRLCKKCMKKQKMQGGGEAPTNVVDAFKCGRKMRKAENGYPFQKKKRINQ